MKMIVYAVEAAERPLLERYGKQFGWELTLLAAKAERRPIAAPAEGMDVVNVLCVYLYHAKAAGCLPRRRRKDGSQPHGGGGAYRCGLCQRRRHRCGQCTILSR